MKEAHIHPSLPMILLPLSSSLGSYSFTGHYSHKSVVSYAAAPFGLIGSAGTRPAWHVNSTPQDQLDIHCRRTKGATNKLDDKLIQSSITHGLTCCLAAAAWDF
jgi:hypothetical protein